MSECTHACLAGAPEEAGDLRLAAAPRVCVSTMMGLGEETIVARERRASAAVSLFSSWFCPYAQRAWVALEEAGVDYRWHEIQPYRLRAMSQRGGRGTERLQCRG